MRKRILGLCLVLTLAASFAATAAAETAVFVQGPFLVEPYDPRVDNRVFIDYTSREEPCFELLLKVRDPQGNPVGGLGCGFAGNHTTDLNGEVLLQWSGTSRGLTLFNRYVGAKEPGYEDAYHLQVEDAGLTGRQTLLLVWAHQSPLDALEQVSNLLDLRVTDHLGNPKDGLTIEVFHQERPFGEDPVVPFFSGEPGRYVWRGLRTGQYVADVSGPDGEEGQIKFTHRGERLALRLQLEDPSVTARRRQALDAAAAANPAQIERVGQSAITFSNLGFIPEFSQNNLGGVQYDKYQGLATVGVLRADKIAGGRADGPSLLFTADLWENRLTWRSDTPWPPDAEKPGLNGISEERLVEIARRLAAIAGMSEEERETFLRQPPATAENPAFLIERYDPSNPEQGRQNEAALGYGADVPVLLRVTGPDGRPVAGLGCAMEMEYDRRRTDSKGESLFWMKPNQRVGLSLFHPDSWEWGAGAGERYFVTLQRGFDEAVLSLIWEGEDPAARPKAENRVELALVDEWGTPLVNQPFDISIPPAGLLKPATSPAMKISWQTDAQGRGEWPMSDGEPRWLTLSAAGRNLSFYYPGGVHRVTAVAPFRMRGRQEADLVLVEPEGDFPRMAARPASAAPDLSRQGLLLKPVASVEGPAPPSEAKAVLRVVDRDGGPVRGLDCAVATGDGELRQRTDGFGRCVFPIPLRTALSVVLENPHAGAVQRHRVTAGRSSEDGILLFTLVWEGETPGQSLERQENRLSLTATDVRGRPLPDVALRLERDGALLREGTTDCYGGQVWCGLPKGSYRLTLTAGDGTGKEYPFSYPGGALSLSVPLAADPDADFTLGRFDPDDPAHTAFAPVPAGTGSRAVTLRVLTPRGKAAQGLLVRFGGQSCLLDEKGECRLTVREGETASLSIQNDVPFPDRPDDPRFRADYRVTVRKDAKSPTLLLVWEGYLPEETASAGRCLHLSVTDAQYQPIPGVKLWLCERQPGGRLIPPQGAAYTLTDEKGERTRCAVAPGSYTLFLQREGERGYVRLDTRLSDAFYQSIHVTLGGKPEIFPEQEELRPIAVVQIPTGKAVFPDAAPAGETVRVKLRAALSKNTAVAVPGLCCETGGVRLYTGESGEAVLSLAAKTPQRLRLYNDLPGQGKTDDPAYCSEYLIAADQDCQTGLTAGWSGTTPNESKAAAPDWLRVEVRDKEDKVFEGLRVWLVNEQSGVSHGPRVTDYRGDATFLDLPAGRYRIKVEREDKQICEASVDYAGQGGHACITRLPAKGA